MFTNTPWPQGRKDPRFQRAKESMITHNEREREFEVKGVEAEAWKRASEVGA